MSDTSIHGASRPSRRLTIASLILWTLLALALPLSALTLNVFRPSGLPLGYWVAAQGALLGLVALTFLFARRAGGVSDAGGLQPALVFAGEIVGAAVLIGFTGYIAALGFDGLSLPLGLVAGLALLTITIAPRFVLYPVQSIAGFFAIRFGGGSTRRLALLISVAAGLLVLAADLRAGGIALQVLTGLPTVQAIGILAGSIALIWLLRRLLVPKRIAGIAYLVALLGLFITLTGLAWLMGGFPIPHLTLGAVLEQHANLNITLIVNKLANVQSLPPMASPFLQLTMVNFAGFVVAVALGVACAPHLLGRHISQASVTPGGAVRRTAWATAAVALVAMSLAPLAIYERSAFEQYLSKGIENAAVPEAFADYSAVGLVAVCGVRSSDAAEISAACAKAPGQRGFLRMQDLEFTTVGLVTAGPAIAGVPAAIRMPLLIAAVLATIIAGHALLAGITSADAEVRRTFSQEPRGRLDLRSVVIAIVLLLAASFTAALSAAPAGTLVTEGFALFAAGMFPALMLGLHWRQMNAPGAVAAMLIGTLLTGLYIAGVHFFPAHLFKLTAAFSDASPAAIKQFADLEAALAVAQGDAIGPARAALAKHAATVANWGGLKTGAVVLVTIPIGFFIGIVGSIVSKAPRGERSEKNPAFR